VSQAGARQPSLSREAAIAEEAVRALFKAQRAQQLYHASSPARAAAIESARAQLRKAWEVADPLVFGVRRHALLFNEEPVLAESSKAGDGLAWLLYREGIREIRFLQGFEQAELEVLLDILGRARVATINEDDLVTTLWLANLTFFSYRHVEVVLSAGDGGGDATPSGAAEDAEFSQDRFSLFGPQGQRTSVTLPASVDEELAGFLDAAAPAILPPDDDQRLQLDPAELALLEQELAREYGSGFRQTVLEALLEIIEMDVDEASRLEVVGALDELLLEVLGTGGYEMAAAVLGEAERLLATADLDATVLEALGRLAGRVSTPGVLRPLLQQLADPLRAPPVDVVERLFDELRPDALPLLAGWLGVWGQAPGRALVERAARRLAALHPGALVDALGSAEASVLEGALVLAAHHPADALVPALCKVARHEDAVLRQAALAILADCDGPAVRALLPAACRDRDRHVRITAYRIVQGRRMTEARAALQEVVAGGGHGALDLNERIALFEALGAVADASTIDLFDRLLNGRGLMGPKESPEVRACAVRGLARASAPGARRALERADGGRDPLVQRAVRLALAGEAGA
jgi:hypothetical protein